MAKRLIITKLYNRMISMLFEENKEIRIDVYEDADTMDNIYVGRVKDVVKNINAAFIEYMPGVTGYFSMVENEHPLFLNPKKNSTLSQGDLLLVQVKKAPVKTKAAVLSCNIGLTGDYVALNYDHGEVVGVSKKITEKKRAHQLKQLVQPYASQGFSLIVRTDAELAKDEEILEEVEHLKREFEEILRLAATRTAFSLMKASKSHLLRDIQSCHLHEEDEILTDLKDHHALIQGNFNGNLRFYEDAKLPLWKLYSLESRLEEALNKKVWLKSGGYLIIEPTEALTVIDVNTGKYQGAGKDREATFLKINLEAATEIARQLILRNLSGIILVDFISMEREESRHELEGLLKNLLSKDPVKAVFIDFTKLDLAEITRKKVKKPLHEYPFINKDSEILE